MSIVAADLVLCTSVNHATDDVSTQGGAIDTTRRPVFTQFAGSARVALVSDGADTRIATVYFRTDGSLTSEAVALNGVSEVLTTATAERLVSVMLDANSATRTVSVKEGSGGTVRATIGPNFQGVTIGFINSTSQAGSVARYEKHHFKNTNSTATLAGAIVTLTADPSSRIKIGLAASLNDTDTVANRLAAPGGVVFVDDNVDINVPTDILAAGDSIGVWIEQGLLAADPPFKSTYSLRLSGTSS